MIKTVHIEGFQSHEDTLLEFSPGVNVIVGPTDSGKTAVLRALRWIIYNKPGGEAFRNSKGIDTNVTIETNEGNVIKRSKTTGNNSYHLNKEVFKAFGTKVPSSIESALNLSEINAQSQFDEPYLLNSSAGEVAIHFNKIANIEQIDKSNKLITSWVQTIKHNITSTEETLKDQNKDLLTYDYLENFEKDLQKVEKIDKEITEVGNDEDNITALLVDLNEVESEIEENAEILTVEKLVDSILSYMDKVNEEEDKIIGLVTLKDEIIEINDDLEIYEELSKVSVDELIAQAEIIEESTNNINLLNSTILLIEKTGLDKTNLEIKLSIAEEEFSESMGDVCVLCEQKIKR